MSYPRAKSTCGTSSPPISLASLLPAGQAGFSLTACPAGSKLEHTVPLRFTAYEGMDIGTDNGLPVVPKLGYAKLLPKHFQGTIEKVEFNVGPAKITAEHLQRIYLERFASAVRN